MSEKKLSARIVHKHDVEANWLKATNFIPKQGEIIVYDKDASHNYGRIKVGDGETTVSSLPFTTATVLSDAKLYIDEQIESLMDGDFAISNAEYAETAGHATTADSATSAESANIANSATKATQDASGNVITATYETKTDAESKLNSAKEYTDEKISTLVGDTAVADQINAVADSIQDQLLELSTSKADSEHSHSNYVDLSSDQEIIGGKTFTESTMFTKGIGIGEAVMAFDSETKSIVFSFPDNDTE